ncbi:MAG: endocytosis defective- protein [Chaenotheca gracillima]|nr:MAG: endocytosis defective- protein [Chaenotheca gracillima]
MRGAGKEIKSPPEPSKSPRYPKLAPPKYFGGPRRLALSYYRNSTFSLLRYLFPHTRQRARAHLFDFRHETVPYYRQRAQSRIYRFIVQQQSRRLERKRRGEQNTGAAGSGGVGVLAYLRKRGRRIFGRKAGIGSRAGVQHVAFGSSRQRKAMMLRPGAPASEDAGSLSAGEGSDSWRGEGKERGARRRKLAGYLKAANELRQSYQQSYRPGNSQDQFGNGQDYDQDIPGAFPDVAVVRGGGEEMVLFPSYAKRHVKKDRSQLQREEEAENSRNSQSGQQNTTADQAEYWRREWEKHEDDKAIVDVDIRGWIYAPHRGPLTRKNRLLIGLARQLSGIPAPADAEQENEEVPRDGSSKRRSAREQELVSKEAESIMKKGEGEADIAGRGGYSEAPSNDIDKASIYSKDSRSSTPNPDTRREPSPDKAARPLTNSSLTAEASNESDSHFKRASWSQPAKMSSKELAVANTHLMSRLMPFLTNPLPSVPITMFFYNESTSQSRTTMTNEAGHFSERFALDFVPSHVRVLASDSLSATEEVLVTEPYGVSLISDIDDTIKHSAIGSGAREIFRNTFIRDLSDLTIEGVKDWYKRLAEMGVRLHYVSNSPWQLYPLLVRFFALAGLPPGSFHLKQYSGMLQGIFEPVAERKKSTLEKIMHDFPERKFVLVGDSGEADLEVYTDVVTANPGRIIGVFIRDVTTPKSQGFFDSAMGPLNGEQKVDPSKARNGSVATTSGVVEDGHEKRPPIPPRKSVAEAAPRSQSGPAMGTLIDFGEEHEQKPPQGPSPLSRSLTNEQADTDADRSASTSGAEGRRSPPARPIKPLSLRSMSNSSEAAPVLPGRPGSDLNKKPPPPPPTPKPRRPLNLRAEESNGSAVSQHSSKDSEEKSNPGTQVMSGTRQMISSAYNRLPSGPGAFTSNAGGAMNSPSLPSRPANPSTRSTSYAPSSASSGNESTGSNKPAPPPPPPRRNITSYPAAAAQYASNRIGWTTGPANPSSTSSQATTSGTSSRLAAYSTYGSGSGNSSNTNPNNGAPIDKKAELWKRRWTRAREVLASKGVELRSWRVGGDVVEESVKLIQRALKEAEANEKRKRG